MRERNTSQVERRTKGKPKSGGVFEMQSKITIREQEKEQNNSKQNKQRKRKEHTREDGVSTIENMPEKTLTSIKLPLAHSPRRRRVRPPRYFEECRVRYRRGALETCGGVICTPRILHRVVGAIDKRGALQRTFHRILGLQRWATKRFILARSTVTHKYGTWFHRERNINSHRILGLQRWEVP